MARRKKWLSGTALGGGALAILLVAMVVLNPSEKKHRDAIYDAARRQQEERHGAAGALLVTALEAADALKAVPYEYHNYFLFSTITRGGDRVTFGVLGYVRVNGKLVSLDK